MQSLYHYVINSLLEEIYLGKLQPGEKIPSIRELSYKLDVSVNTVHKAIKYLSNEELLVKGQNRINITNNRIIIRNYRDKAAQKLIDRLINDMRNLGINEKEIINTMKNLTELD